MWLSEPVSGNERRQERAKRELRLSSMQTAKAMVGSESEAEARIEWTTLMSGSTRETRARYEVLEVACRAWNDTC